MFKTFFYKQQDKKDCGPTCLKMVCRYYGRYFKIDKLRQLCNTKRGGVSLLDLSEAAEKIGFRTSGAELTIDQLREITLPCILFWQRKHFVVLYRIKKNKWTIADPSVGVVTLDYETLKKNWYAGKKNNKSVALILAPSPFFFEQPNDSKRMGWMKILKYFLSYKTYYMQLALGLAIGTLLSIIAPFFTQSIVDIGINTKNFKVVFLILTAQVMLFLGSTAINFIRSWILLHVSVRVNIAVLTDFLIKLMKLPIAFFENKTTGDIMQRMNDQQKLESFLSNTTLNTVFSFFNLIIFTVILIYYNLTIFLISIICAALYGCWILLFMQRRRELNYEQFENSSVGQTTNIEMIRGIQDIKLNNAETLKRWRWEQLQASLFKFRIKTLSLNQYQASGAILINQTKNILITFISVTAVINGKLTLGGMMAIQYIVGQVSAPIEQFLGFVQSYQDAKISLERLSEIHELDDEGPLERNWILKLPDELRITFKNVLFRYPGAGNDPVIDNINISIPSHKITAIVGASGSGKTTILKMLMRFYEPERGEIQISDKNLNQIDFKLWRENCGVVTHDGYIFSDTISGNIALGDEVADEERLQMAIKIANLGNFINSLPFGLDTQIGGTGHGISQGQKQRIFIARAIYKNPKLLLLDEATNSLDANNEGQIMKNMQSFYQGRTVVVVAHRLSTVMNADQIIVLNQGKVSEQGTHFELLGLKGDYYQLVKNQVEMSLI